MNEVKIISPWMTTSELSEYLKINKTTIYRFVRTRRIPCYRINKSIRFRLDEIDRWTREFFIDVHPLFKKRAEDLAKKKLMATG
jgi:excisionase family DNA binding protein